MHLILYKSNEYQLLRQGISDIHCMSDDYIAEDLQMEYNQLNEMKHGVDTKKNR